ncbi:UDP-Glycosyltransferase/glycogen phosphorylase [Choiromyces venosus 120613-1]|uniref:UDP-Glycosyltransferase/glycogen phosphorylase n=1 Tax=Choiromyces venosus 120613-1 TaxID=1336337 RepID=A0A3N4K7R0_9PEZI|nr:UDP-Glycosyltransferase/glycogen phosphorylase [Choiromyces venosus 120613-1]
MALWSFFILSNAIILCELFTNLTTKPLYIGAAATRIDGKTVKIGISIHDGVYSIDYCINELTVRDGENMRELIRADIIKTIGDYSVAHQAKFVGAGITNGLEDICPGTCAYLWRKLDIVCMRLKVRTTAVGAFDVAGTIPIDVDEQADSAARKCVMYFGPNHNPALAIGFRNQVMPDAQGTIRLVENLKEYEDTVHPGTWRTLLKYANELKGYKDGQTKGDPQGLPTKIAFFSSTPQGGGVALMRHALVRFCSELGVKLNWYIPKPNPKAFRITKTNHNILQGVAEPGARFDEEKQALLNEWIGTNAKRYWLSPGGPLAHGGADVVIIDDPQMPALIPLIRKFRPEIKIIYRSHIEIRSDLVEKPGSPQEQVWGYIWGCVKQADVFISHPVDKFVPHDVPLSMVGLMPACTDWLDGLNKPLRGWDLRFYHHDLRNSCNELGMNQLLYPAREYITQIARFDPSKGIPDVIESYRKLCARMVKEASDMLPPQLLICGHGAVDDPDASIVFVETMELLAQPKYSAIVKDVVVMRIGPSDQMLNAMMTTAKLVVQLSLREGFEVKVSEALHHGKPVVANRAGGIPLQIQHGKSGFLTEVGDTDAVANHLFDLYTDKDLYARMSECAKASVSDEVGTVGNAACWLYLAAKLARGEVVKPNARWITDMAREEADQHYEPGEPKLPRGGINIKGEN